MTIVICRFFFSLLSDNETLKQLCWSVNIKMRFPYRVLRNAKVRAAQFIIVQIFLMFFFFCLSFDCGHRSANAVGIGINSKINEFTL